MNTHRGSRWPAQTVAVGCAVAATGLGLAYLAAAGAPPLLLAVNALSLVLGLALFGAIRASMGAPRLPGSVVVAFGWLLLATALFGVSVEGTARWLRVGGLSLQVSLVVLPAMLIAFARRRDLLSTLGLVLAAVALALQPDRAMGGVLVAALAALATYRRDRWVAAALSVAAAGWLVALLRPDALPAVPFVDGVLFSAWQIHPLAGAAVVGGALLLAVPAVVGWRRDPEQGAVLAVFGAVWLGMVAAAALGNYPTPLVGYGGSAILGYAFSLAFLPGPAASPADAPAATATAARGAGDGAADLRAGAVRPTAPA